MNQNNSQLNAVVNPLSLEQVITEINRREKARDREAVKTERSRKGGTQGSASDGNISAFRAMIESVQRRREEEEAERVKLLASKGTTTTNDTERTIGVNVGLDVDDGTELAEGCSTMESGYSWGHWKVVFSESLGGRPFFYNTVTRTGQLKIPDDLLDQTQKSVDPVVQHVSSLKPSPPSSPFSPNTSSPSSLPSSPPSVRARENSHPSQLQITPSSRSAPVSVPSPPPSPSPSPSPSSRRSSPALSQPQSQDFSYSASSAAFDIYYRQPTSQPIAGSQLIRRTQVLTSDAPSPTHCDGYESEAGSPDGVGYEDRDTCLENLSADVVTHDKDGSNGISDSAAIESSPNDDSESLSLRYNEREPNDSQPHPFPSPTPSASVELPQQPLLVDHSPSSSSSSSPPFAGPEWTESLQPPFTWSCDQCTFLNNLSNSFCDMCGFKNTQRRSARTLANNSFQPSQSSQLSQPSSSSSYMTQSFSQSSQTSSQCALASGTRAGTRGRKSSNSAGHGAAIDDAITYITDSQRKQKQPERPSGSRKAKESTTTPPTKRSKR